MRAAELLFSLAIWVSTSRAFYIWNACRADATCGSEDNALVTCHDDVPKSADMPQGTRSLELVGSKPNSRPTRRDFFRLTRKYARHHQDGHECTAQNSKRANQYNVVAPVEPTQEGAIGVYQDGSDYAYFIKVLLGSAQTPVYMLFDTGATTWVMGSGCDNTACNLHTKYDPASSNTRQAGSDTFDIYYGSGSVGGAKVTDSIRVANVDVAMEFGVADHTTDQFQHFAFDGILGMSLNKGETDNFPRSAKDDKKLKANVFSVALSRTSDGENRGEITMGGINEDKYTGDISYCDVDSKGQGDWTIAIDDIKIGGASAGGKGRLAYIDTGTSYLFGPPSEVESFHMLLGNKGDVWDSTDGVTYTVSCDTTKEMSFVFNGGTYNILPQDWISAPDSNGICWSNVYGHAVIPDSWLLGAVFLKNVYSVFDFTADKQRIGFAKLAVAAQAESPKATSSHNPSTTTANPDSKNKSGSASSDSKTAPDVGLVGGDATATIGESISPQPVSTSQAPTASSESARASASFSLVLITSCIMAVISGISSLVTI